jgi:hypothetical protein
MFVTTLKRCPQCGAFKTSTEYSRRASTKDGLAVYCRECDRKRISARRSRAIASGLCADCGQPRGEEFRRRYCAACARKPGRGAIANRLIRLAVLQAYSQREPTCACCGESTVAFLTLDHVNGGGRAHRSQYSGTLGVYRELKRRGYPAGFEVLCFNCNFARSAYAACPHRPTGLSAKQAAPAPLVVDDAGADGRVCRHCHRRLMPVDFYPNPQARSGLQSWCKACTREAALARLRAARRDALMHYSAGNVRCACCGESEERFLALDHINGAGPRQPGTRPGGNTFFAWLKQHCFPAGLQVLCHNCNGAKGRDGACAHVVHGRALAGSGLWS